MLTIKNEIMYNGAKGRNPFVFRLFAPFTLSDHLPYLVEIE